MKLTGIKDLKNVLNDKVICFLIGLNRNQNQYLQGRQTSQIRISNIRNKKAIQIFSLTAVSFFISFNQCLLRRWANNQVKSFKDNNAGFIKD